MSLDGMDTMPLPVPTLLVGDCFDLLDGVDDRSVALVLADLPYGTTRCSWDTVLPLDKLWAALKRVLAPKGVMLFTATQPFATTLIHSNLADFRYEWVWEKSKAAGWMNCKKQPLRAHELVLVFGGRGGVYNPQMVQSTPYTKGTAHRPTAVYGAQVETTVTNTTGLRYPRSVQYFKTAESEGRSQHPTQKPLGLYRYLIKTYTNEGDLVLDPCAGACTTAVAATELQRRSICMELEEKYVEIGRERVRSISEA